MCLSADDPRTPFGLDTIISSTPLWLLYILTARFVLLGFQLGWLLGRRTRDIQGEKDAPIGAIVAATFALLAFMLGFTFNMAASRFETRKQYVLQEASAIYTAYLRADFLTEPQSSSIQSTLKEYASLRTQGVTALRTPAIIAKSNELQQRIWADTVAATQNGAKSTSPVLDGLFVQAVNQLFDTDAARVQAGRNQVPDSSCDRADRRPGCAASRLPPSQPAAHLGRDRQDEYAGALTGVYRPFQTGARFSINASMPSCASSAIMLHAITSAA